MLVRCLLAQLEEVFGHVEVNTKELVTRSGSGERASHSLRAIQILLAATMGCARYTGLAESIPAASVCVRVPAG
jgi:hypothetical protein